MKERGRWFTDPVVEGRLYKRNRAKRKTGPNLRSPVLTQIGTRVPGSALNHPGRTLHSLISPLAHAEEAPLSSKGAITSTQDTMNSSIHRLDSSSWILIARFLDSGDIIRLCGIGNASLATLLRSEIRDLKLAWTSLHIIDLHRVMRQISNFKSVTHLSFRQEGCINRCWVPVNWTLLSPTLTSLSMSFFGSPGVFLEKDLNIGRILPLLRYLDLEDTLLFPKFASASSPQRPSLTRLPPTLVYLRIASHIPLDLNVGDVALLPPDIETLELDILKTTLTPAAP